jgi:hypothetical protein
VASQRNAIGYATASFLVVVVLVVGGLVFASAMNRLLIITATNYVDISGYWTNGQTQHPGGGVSQGVLHPFPPGTYTIVIADAWGHVKNLYFQVV